MIRDERYMRILWELVGLAWDSGLRGDDVDSAVLGCLDGMGIVIRLREVE